MGFLKNFKSVLVSALLLGSVAIAASAVISLDEVNKKVEALIAPLNTDTTVLQFAFTRLAVDKVRATDFGFNAYVLKKGLKNDVELSAPAIEYSYGDGKNPTAKFDLALKFDVVKAFGHETINMFSESIEELALDTAKSFTQQYGAAVSITTNVLDKKTDANGNVSSVKMTLSARFDLSKLPATKPASEVELQSVDIEVLGNQSGFKVSVNAVLNPEYSRFASGNDGLKEYVEKLLSDDQDTYMELGQLLGFLDLLLTSLAEAEAQ